MRRPQKPKAKTKNARAAAGEAAQSVWRYAPSDFWRSGYQSVLAQAAYGSLANLVGEFAPEIAAKLKRK